MFRRPVIAILVLSLAVGTAAAAEHKVIAPPGTDLGLPFSPGIQSDDFLFLSGAIGNEPGTVKVEGDVAAQTRQTLENLGAVLKAAGMDFSRVVEANVFLADSRHFQAMGTVYGEFLGEALPVRATVEADIAIPGALTEISLVAARPGVKIRRITPEGWPETGGSFSWGMLAGDTLFVAGMVSSDPGTGQLVPGDVGAQARQVMKNVGAVLDAAGMSFGDLVSCGVFLADPRDYAAMNEAYGESFAGVTPPTRATVRARLVNPILGIEIQCRGVKAANRKLVAPEGYVASGRPLSPAIQAGDRLFLSGMVGRGPDGYPAGVEAQTRVALDRLAETLAAAGMDFRDVEMASVFLTDIRHYGVMNAVYREVVGSPPPARATVGAPLMSPDALVEIQMTARKAVP
ncbi:MAG: RidA family protein [bacterium]|nr:RidA family protein [bacterium]